MSGASLRLAVVGAGAIGGPIAAGLIRAGHDVTLIDRDQDHIDAIRASGLRITGPVQEAAVSAPVFLPEEVTGQFDTILLCVKAHATRGAMNDVAPLLTADGYVVSIQNGLNETTIAEVIGSHRTVGCFVNFGADRTDPGVIHYGGRGALVLGELDGSSSTRLRELHSALAAFEPDVATTDNIWGYLWAKLTVGSMIYATALTDRSIADCYAQPAYRDLFTAIAREVLNLASVQGITPERFDGFDPAAFSPAAGERAAHASLDDMSAFNARSAKSHSGVWRDLRVHKRKTEADEHLGGIMEIARRTGTPVPLITEIHRMITEIEGGIRSCSDTNLEELSRMVTA